MFKILEYIKARLNERSTLVGIGVAITAASALPHPWNYYSLVVGTAASFVKDGTVSA